MRRGTESSARALLRTSLIVLSALAALAVIGSALFYLVIYPRQVIGYVEVEFVGSRYPLSEQTNALLKQLQGASFASCDTDEISQQLEREGLISEASVSKKYPDHLYVRLRTLDPIAVLTLGPDEPEAFLLPFAPDVIAAADGSYFKGYETLVRELSATLPVCTIVSSAGLISREGTVSPRFLAYIDMLGELRQDTPGIYNLITEIKYGTTTHSEMELWVRHGTALIQYAMAIPVRARSLAETIGYTSQLIEPAETQSVYRFSVFDTYAVIDHGTLSAGKGVGFGIR
jgi:hypothetical protein